MSEPRSICPRCLRPAAVCYCDQLPTLPSRTRVLLLQHPRERKVPVGTARMASLCLPNSRLFVGIDFSSNSELTGELGDPSRPAALLWPGPGSVDLASAPPSGPITLVVVDGTWSTAKSLVRDNPAVAQLPRYRLDPPPSEYTIRQEPRGDYVSTLEALAHALAILEGDEAIFERLMAPLRRLVSLQEKHRESRRGEASRHRFRWAGQPDKAPRLPRALTDPGSQLVCAVAEANAWNARLPGAHPDELIHWLACRLSTGETFEAVLAPSFPLAPSTPVHTRLPAERILAGLPREELAPRWSAFLREGDVLCTWGDYALQLAESAGARLPAQRVDLRKVAGDLVQGSPGAMDRFIEEWQLSSVPSGEGRGGERLGQLTAIARHLARAPRTRRA